MDYQPRLLKSSFVTLFISFAVVALLALPRSAAADNFYSMAVAPQNTTQSGTWFGQFIATVAAGSFTDHYLFTAADTFKIQLGDFIYFNSGATGSYNVTSLVADLYNDPHGTVLYSGANLLNSTQSGSFAAGNYDLQIKGVAGTGGATYWGMATLETNNSAIFAPVPEPETYAMMLVGLGLMGFVARRRKQVQELA